MMNSIDCYNTFIKTKHGKRDVNANNFNSLYATSDKGECDFIKFRIWMACDDFRIKDYTSSDVHCLIVAFILSGESILESVSISFYPYVFDLCNLIY